MARLRARMERAAALHRQAAALIEAATPVLEAYAPASAPADQYAEQHALAASLRADAATLAPGWLGTQLDALAPSTPLGGPLPPTFVRIGQAHPLDDASFPVVVPLLRAGHIAVDADARDIRVAGLLRSLVLRLLASAPAGSVLIRAVDAADPGGTFANFAGINTIMPPAASDVVGLRRVLDEAEAWTAGRPADGAGPTLLLVIASMPELTEGRDLARLTALAHSGPAGRLHLIAAGWPPPPLTSETTQAPLPHATQVSLRNPYCWVGDPPGTTFSGSGKTPSRLNAPVYLDPDPPAELIRSVCAQLTQAGGGTQTLAGESVRATWLEYVAAAQRLDVVRRKTATVVAEHTAALAAARDDLASVRAKLTQHRMRLTELARQAGGRPINLSPAWPDTQAAQAQLAGLPVDGGRPVRPGPLAPQGPYGRPPAGAPMTGYLNAPPVSGPPMARPVSGSPGGAYPPISGPPRAGAPISGVPRTGPPTSGPPTSGPPRTGAPVSGPPRAGSPAPGQTGAFPTQASPTSTGPLAAQRGPLPPPGQPVPPPYARPGPPVAPMSVPPIGPVSSQTGSLTAQPGRPGAQADPRSSQTDPRSSQTGPLSSQTGPLSSQTGGLGGGARPVNGPATGTIPAVAGDVRPVSPAPGSVPSRVSAALRRAAVNLDASRGALADGAKGEPGTGDDDPRVWRNVIVYGLFAVLATFVQAPALTAAGRSAAAALFALVSALILPFMSFGLGWLTIGTFGRTPAANRSGLLGALISLLAFLPLVLMMAFFELSPFGR